MTAFVHIVLVNFNGHLDTIECIESVLKSSHTEYKIWIVDNSPTHDSIHSLVQWANGTSNSIETAFPDLVYPAAPKPVSHRLLSESELHAGKTFEEKILFVKANENKGFAAANNIVLRHLASLPDWHFAWILNNDTVITPETLSTLITFASQPKQTAGMIGAKVMEYNQPSVIQCVGCMYYKWIGKIAELAKGETDQGQWDKRGVKPDYVLGASIFISRELLRKIGPMEEDYFLYFEEIDWAIRARAAGSEVAYCYEAIVYHKGGSTIKGGGGNSRMMDFYYARNRILLAIKFFPYTLPVLYLSFGWFVLRRISKRQADRVWMLLKIMMHPHRFFNS